MVSQERAGPGDLLTCYKIQSVFKRVHAYKEYLEPKPGQALKLKREHSNKQLLL